MSLEKLYTPDFTKLYPNTGLRHVPSYPGKRLLVLVLMPQKTNTMRFQSETGRQYGAADP